MAPVAEGHSGDGFVHPASGAAGRGHSLLALFRNDKAGTSRRTERGDEA
jgi:hypothetical protein